MTTSDQRKTDGGKDDRDRGSLALRRMSAFYRRSACCNAHILKPMGEECWICTKCKKICAVAEG